MVRFATFSVSGRSCSKHIHIFLYIMLLNFQTSGIYNKHLTVIAVNIMIVIWEI